jgi:hypothetical protein
MEGRPSTKQQLIAACEMVLKVKPQELGASAGVSASQGFSMTNDCRQSGPAQPDPADISEEKNDETFQKIPEVPTNLVQPSENASTASSRMSLPRIPWRVMKQIGDWLAFGWNRARQQVRFEQRRKRLRVCESLSLGEKRFVALIEVDGEQFLIGGATSGLATLARLQPSREFAGMLKERWIREPREV